MDQEISFSHTYVDRVLVLQGKCPQTLKKQVDFRKQVFDSLLYPFSCVGLFWTQPPELKKQKKGMKGTGFLIGSNLVLTCAHNFFFKSKPVPQEYISFYPGINRTKKRQKSISVQKVHYDPKYLQEQTFQQSQYDFALVELKQSIGDIHGYLGADFRQENIYEEEQFRMYGYSKLDKKEDKEFFKYQMVESPGICKGVNQDFISYDEATGYGQSGGPIIIQRDGNFFVVGIHLGRKVLEEKSDGRANHLTKEKLRLIENLLSEKSFNQKYEANLSWHSFEDAMEFLNHEQNMKGVSTLNLSCCQFRYDPICIENFGNRNFEFITHLDLSYNQISTEGIKYLKLFPKVKKLILFKNLLQKDFVASLIKINLQNLEVLDLGMNDIRDDSGFSGLKDLKRLEVLKISSIGISDRGLKSLEIGKRLSIIILSDNNIGENTLVRLTRWSENFTEIDVSKNQITDDGIKRVKQHKFPYLKKLNLSQNKLSDECVGEFPKMNDVNWLDLSCNHISEKGFMKIGETLELKKIREFVLCQ